MERSEDGFRRVFNRHHRAIYAYCLRRTNPEDALDASAEVFLTLWRRMDAVPDEDELLPWLYVVARRVMSRQWRGRHRRQRLQHKVETEVRAVSAAPDDGVVRRAEYDLVAHALNKLRPADREILRLAAWDELPHSTMADLLGCSTNAVDQRLHRARKRLAREYQSLERRLHRAGAATAPLEEGGEL